MAVHLVVGQELWFSPTVNLHHRPDSFAVTITKIGRRWANITRGLGRVDVNTLWVDGAGYTSPGRCWLSKDDWETEQLRQLAWRELEDFVRSNHRAPPVSEPVIREAIKLLTGTPPEQTT